MPLRDHFHNPLAARRSWEGLHGAWPGTIAFRLNAILPPEFYSDVRVRLGNAVEIDITAFEDESSPERSISTLNQETEWEPARPSLLLETEEFVPPEYEVRVYDERKQRRLVAAIEIVSPRNKDRAESRDAFVSKCHALLQQDVCVVIVDLVTDRTANLYGALAERLGAARPTIAAEPIYAVSCRARLVENRWRLESWEHPLTIGRPLPTLPIWLNESRSVPLELDQTYEETCRGLRIA